jgi:U3 small nucleolar RNA-associated protein 23
MERLRLIKKQELGETTMKTPIKRRKAKGPNPLSCKKKKKKACVLEPLKTVEESSSQPQRIKKRRRVKIAEHIRKELVSRLNVSKTTD